MRGLEKSSMGKGQARKHADGHRDSMKESAKGRFFETVSDGQDSWRLAMQLQTANTVAGCQDNCRLLHTIADTFVHVFSVRR